MPSATGPFLLDASWAAGIKSENGCASPPSVGEREPVAAFPEGAPISESIKGIIGSPITVVGQLFGRENLLNV
jgi:hypothetical protein